MARKIAPLSDAKIKKAKPKTKLYKLFDGGGLYLAVLPSGAKSWRMKYNDPLTQREKTETLGLYPDVSLAAARRARDEIRAALAAGRTPARRDMTLAEISDAFLSRKNIGESHLRRQRRRLELYILPTFGRMTPDEISRADLVDVLRAIDDRGKNETARRVFSLVSEVLRFAVASGWADHNILSDIRPGDILRPKNEKHMRTLTDPDEISRLMSTIRDYPGRDITMLALEMLALTAVRPGNIRSARWEDIDTDRALWSIPAEQMKMKNAHIVPLSPQALDVLRRVSVFTGDCALVFPSPLYRDRPMSENTLNFALRRLGWGDRIVAHGFRAMFSTIAHERISEHGCDPLVIEAALAHKERDEVKAAYNRAVYLDQRRTLMEWWGEWLQG